MKSLQFFLCLLIAGISQTAPIAAQQNVDYFASGGTIYTSTVQSSSSAVGGRRYIFFHPGSGTAGTPTVAVGGNRFNAAIPNGRNQRLDIIYGGDKTKNYPLNLNLTNRGNLCIEFDCVLMKTGLFGATIHSNNGAAYANFSRSLPINRSPHVVRVPMSGMSKTAGFTWADVDTITLFFQGMGTSDPVDFGIRRVWFE